MNLRHFVTSCWIGLLAASGCGVGGPPAGYDATQAVRLDPAWRVGAPGPGVEAPFGRVHSFAADSAGTVYAGDIYGDFVRASDSTGTVRWKMGTTGEGPGEFDEIGYMTAAHGRVYVVDEGTARVTVLNARDGSVLATAPYRMPGVGTFLNGQPPRVRDPDRISFGALRIFLEPDDRYPVENELREYHLTLDLATGDTSISILPNRTRDLYLFERRNGQPEGVILPFMPWQVWTPNPRGGTTVAWGGEYRIVETDSLGDTLRVLSRDVGPRRVTPRGLELARQQTLRVLRPYIGAARAMDVPLPDPQPQVIGLAYSRDGRQLWVRRAQWDPEPVYDVFADGRYRCTVELATGEHGLGNLPFANIQVVNDRAFHHIRDERTDVPYVGAYRVPDACRADDGARS